MITIGTLCQCSEFEFCQSNKWNLSLYFLSTPWCTSDLWARLSSPLVFSEIVSFWIFYNLLFSWALVSFLHNFCYILATGRPCFSSHVSVCTTFFPFLLDAVYGAQILRLKCCLFLIFQQIFGISEIFPKLILLFLLIVISQWCCCSNVLTTFGK